MSNSQDAQRRGPWQPGEDSKLLSLIEQHGPENWVRLSELVGTRTAKQCRERYHQKLKPDLNHTPITEAEGARIAEMYRRIGPRWAEISRLLGNRSDNAVKNYWNGSQNRQKRDEQRRHRHPYRGSHHHHSHSHSHSHSHALHLQKPLPQLGNHHHNYPSYPRGYYGEGHHQDRAGHHYSYSYHESSSPPAASHLPPLFGDAAAASPPAEHFLRGGRMLPSINTTFPSTSRPMLSPHSTGFESPLSSPDSATFDQGRLHYSHQHYHSSPHHHSCSPPHSGNDADWRPATRDSSSTVGSVSAYPQRCHDGYASGMVPRRLPSPEEKADDKPKDDRMTLKTILC